MILTFEQWNEILNTLEPNNSNKSTILDQIKAKLQKQHQDIHEEWEKENFDENYPFNVSFTVNNCQEHASLTLLHIVASNGRLDIVKYLVDEKGVDFNQADNKGNTALHLAAYNGHLDTVRYLIDEKKVDVNQANNNGTTALNGAVCNGHLDTVRYLIDEKEADVNQADNNGSTALHGAASNGHLDIVKYLIDEKKVDVNQANSDGYTALHLGVYKSKVDIVKFLLNKGADPLLKSSEGKTPRDLASNENMRQLLEEAENKQSITKQEVSSISNVQPHNPRSTKGNKLPIITAGAGLLLGLGIAYLAGTTALTPIVAAIAVFVAFAVAGALVGYGIGKVSQKLFVESANEHSKQELKV